MHERNDAVDVRIRVEDAGLFNFTRHEARHARRTVNAGKHADVVARAGLAVGAPVAFEGGACLERQQRLLLRILGKGIVAIELAEGAVVGVDVAAGRNRLRRKADDLTELQNRRALLDQSRRHLVPARHAGGRRNALRAGALGNLVDRNDHVVARMQAQSSRLSFGLGNLLVLHHGLSLTFELF